MKKILCFAALFLLCAVALGACGEPSPAADTCTVTYSWRFPGEGEETHVYSYSIEKGECAYNISLPGDARYQLDSWYYQEQPWKFSTPIYENITLQANWVPCAYTISYMINGETRIEGTFYYGEKVGDPYQENPDRLISLKEWQEKIENGYQFVGWTLQGKLLDFENEIVTKDMTLEALFVLADTNT